MAISAGELRHRVNIQRKVPGQNQVSGSPTHTWETLFSMVPAKIAFLSVKDLMAAQAIQSKVTCRITIRYRDGLDATMRIVGASGCYKDKVFNPAGWLNDLESGVEYLTAPCSQGVNQG